MLPRYVCKSIILSRGLSPQKMCIKGAIGPTDRTARSDVLLPSKSPHAKSYPVISTTPAPMMVTSAVVSARSVSGGKCASAQTGAKEQRIGSIKTAFFSIL